MFDLRPGDVFGCVADIGWITGHSHVVYGPLASGGTAIMFESTPVYPDPGQWECTWLQLVSGVLGGRLGSRLGQVQEVMELDWDSLTALRSPEVPQPSARYQAGAGVSPSHAVCGPIVCVGDAARGCGGHAKVVCVWTR